MDSVTPAPSSGLPDLQPGSELLQDARARANGSGATPLQVALRKKWQVLAFAIVMTALVAAMVGQLPARYSASASLIIDLRQPHISNGETLLPTQTVDLDLLRTYMVGLRSPLLAREVVQKLNLNTNPEYCAKVQKSKLPLFGPPRPPGPVKPVRSASRQACWVSVSEAATQLATAVFASNDGRSYVITINAEAGSPELAATIANTYSTAYIGRQQRERAALNNQAEVWLTAHVKELRTAVVAADAAVERQRQGEQLTNLRGDTLLTQSLAETNSQLTVATADLAGRQSMLDSLVQLVGSGLTSMDASSPVLASPIIQAMVEREALLSSEYVEMQTLLGAGNPKLQAVAAQRDLIRQQIRVEVNKTVSSLRSDVAALKTRRLSLSAMVKDLQARAEAQGIAQNRLQDLVAEATAARSLYNEAALRLEQIQIDSAVQHADVQVVVEASPPRFPSFPRTRMILTGTFMAMLGLGAALAYAATLLSRVFQDTDQVEDQTGLMVLGLFPKFPKQRRTQSDGAEPEYDPGDTEAIHAVLGNLVGRHSRDGSKLGWVVMVTSSVPAEGKTSFSAALSRAAASRGLSVAVTDCDFRRSSLRGLFPAVRTAAEPADPDDDNDAHDPAIEFEETALDKASGVNVLLAAPPPGEAATLKPHARLASGSFLQMLKRLRAKHDLVVVDTPPVLAVPDVLSIAGLADQVVMLVAWRKTARSTVLSALKMLRRAHAPVSGIVLSKVDLKKFARTIGGQSHYARSYPGYE